MSDFTQISNCVAATDWFFITFSLALILLAATNVIQSLSKISIAPPGQTQLQEMGLESLINSFARGEIDREEFEQRRRNLNS